MFNLFKKKESDAPQNKISILSIACLLIHAARIDNNYSSHEKKIIKETLIKLGASNEDMVGLIEKAEILEKDSNQILEFTKEAKNLEEEKKLILLEALWTIIYSDENVDMYEENLMRRLCGLLYLDKNLVGNIKEKVKNKNL
tara:strand:- start:1209 stop:1634 length:426 start_codon:yes stop_codon:yes gene_type:complete